MLAGFTVGESGDDISESRKRLIDLFTLLKPLTRGTSNPDALAASKINEVKFTNFDFPGRIKSLSHCILIIRQRRHLFNYNDKNCM